MFFEKKWKLHIEIHKRILRELGRLLVRKAVNSSYIPHGDKKDER